MGIAAWLKKRVYDGTNPEQRLSIFEQKTKILVKEKKQYPASVRLVILWTETLIEHFAIYYSARKSGRPVETYRENLDQIVKLCNELEGVRGRSARSEYYNFHVGKNSGLYLGKLQQIKRNIETDKLDTAILFPLFEEYITAFLRSHGINPWD